MVKKKNFYLEHFDEDETEKKNIFVGDSIKVGFIFKEKRKNKKDKDKKVSFTIEERLQFFTGTVTKISGHKITLYQPGVERIFSYKNPQNCLIMAVPKRRSKSRKILWRKKSLKKNRQKRCALLW